MEGPLRGLLAGAAAWKFGGGCISTILVFIIVFWLLGTLNTPWSTIASWAYATNLSAAASATCSGVSNTKMLDRLSIEQCR
ncbi:MAG: hypothetical protein M3R52_02090 [Acidobacteriota bacterium]|nr:hypothetical protein [Acidobacteriota bacterium]